MGGGGARERQRYSAWVYIKINEGETRDKKASRRVRAYRIRIQTKKTHKRCRERRKSGRRKLVHLLPEPHPREGALALGEVDVRARDRARMARLLGSCAFSLAALIDLAQDMDMSSASNQDTGRERKLGRDVLYDGA